MCVALVVDLSYSVDNLLENRSTMVFGQTLIGKFFYVMIYWHSVTQLHDQVYMSSLIYNFVKTHYIRMSKIRKSIDFIVNSILCFLLHQIFLLVSFQSNYCLRFFMYSSSYDCKRSLTYLQSNLEVF